MEKRPKLVILQAKKLVNLQLFFTVILVLAIHELFDIIYSERSMRRIQRGDA